jgi:hypothetical protein
MTTTVQSHPLISIGTNPTLQAARLIADFSTSRAWIHPSRGVHPRIGIAFIKQRLAGFIRTQVA